GGPCRAGGTPGDGERGPEPVAAHDGGRTGARGGNAPTGAVGRAREGRPGTARSASAQPSGRLMLTIQGMPKRSVHIPNTSPHICFSIGTDTEPPPDSLSQ